MDTKLKSSHRLGILIIMLALLLASASTIGLYPYMKTKAESYHNRSSVRQVEESSNFGNLATQVMNFSYEIWHLKMQEDTGRRLTYAQTFLPGLEEKIRRQEPKDEAAVQLGDGEDGGKSQSTTVRIPMTYTITSPCSRPLTEREANGKASTGSIIPACPMGSVSRMGPTDAAM